MQEFKSNRAINKKDLFCINCGFEGHTMKNCNDAITSYGNILIF